MDSSHRMAEGEECCSNESGWTMYIGSPHTGNNHDDDNSDDSNNNHVKKKGGQDLLNASEESDDSMASDASSGPCNKEALPRGYRKCRGMQGLKHSGGNDERKFFQKKKQYKTEETKFPENKVKGVKEGAGDKLKFKHAQVGLKLTKKPKDN